MPEQKSRFDQWWERMRNTYRLVIMNNETFEEIGSYRLSLLNVYIFLSTLIVMVAFLVVCVIFFTPIRKYVPGYGNLDESSMVYKMNKELQSLESELEAQRLYTENFRRMLVGDVQEPDHVDQQNPIPADSIAEVERIEEDELLRKEMELEQKLRVSDLEVQGVNVSPKSFTIEQLYITPPVKGQVSAGFMPDKAHYGVDVLAPKNTAVKAALDGFVISSDWTLETGYTIGIQHDNNLLTFYKHNSSLLKRSGDYVKAGEAIAIIGNSGTLSSGPHLHFEVWNNGKPLDPEEYVNFD